MGKVRLEITPSLASISETQGSDWLILEKALEKETTIVDLLAELASGNTDLRQVIFNPATGQINEQLNVVLNNRLLPSTDMAKVKLNDGDRVILLTVYSGG